MARRLSLRRGARKLCREFDLEIRAGQCVAILGRNGAGKTSLLHALAGLHGAIEGGGAPDVCGEIRLGARPLADWPPLQMARFRGLLPQRQPMPFAASVRETVLVGRHPHLGRWGWESAADIAIAHAALACVDLQELALRDLRALSGGEQQRVALAMLLAQTPRLFLLDEPLNHLDLHHQIAVLELLRALAADGRGVVMVLHDLALAARYADRVVLLDGEGDVTTGTRTEVLTAERLSRAFGHPLRRVEVNGRAVFLPE
ncbi:MAG: ABC transporter ATP-binding protein [Azoarcus sp.]|jgi:iron complex transport system ATP-binding protein|nr:ABC transporter ATP-binding protein [Azoarcus sp.]